MLINNLTGAEKLIIQKCAALMIESLTRIGGNGHELFDEFMEAYEGEPELKLDLALELSEQMEIWEGIKDSPEDYIPKLGVPEIMIFKLVVTLIVPNNKLPKSTRSLISRLDMIMDIRDINLN